MIFCFSFHNQKENKKSGAAVPNRKTQQKHQAGSELLLADQAAGMTERFNLAFLMLSQEPHKKSPAISFCFFKGKNP